MFPSFLTNIHVWFDSKGASRDEEDEVTILSSVVIVNVWCMVSLSNAPSPLQSLKLALQLQAEEDEYARQNPVSYTSRTVRLDPNYESNALQYSR